MAAASAAASAPSPALDFSDLEELDDFDPVTAKRLKYEDFTLWQMFRHEVDIVFRAWIFVLRSWSQIPFKVGVMVSNEVLRFWDFYRGRPMRLRSWQFEFPSREEIFKLRDEL